MTKKRFIVMTLIMLVLSACSGRGAAQTSTPAATNTQPAPAVIATTAPAVTETATVQPSGTPPTATPTVGTVGPTNPPNCTNSASFVTDVTIPDNTSVAGGTIFTKTWRIANNGTCVWGPDYTLVHYSDEAMGAPVSVAVPITYPGQNADISVNLTAPTGTGKHQANFIIKNTAGAIVKIGDDSRLWVVINVTVGGGAASTLIATPTTASTGTAASPLPAATLSAATVPVATVPAATVPAATAGSSSTPSAGSVSCLYTIDRTKLMAVINAINVYRGQKNLPAYTVNPRLAQAAQTHASDIACNHLSGHEGSDGSTPQTRVAATGYVASSVSENVRVSSPPLTGPDAVNSWITDTADANNNQNLVSTTFTEIGVGYAFFDNSGYYVVVFAKP